MESNQVNNESTNPLEWSVAKKTALWTSGALDKLAELGFVTVSADNSTPIGRAYWDQIDAAFQDGEWFPPNELIKVTFTLIQKGRNAGPEDMEKLSKDELIVLDLLMEYRDNRDAMIRFANQQRDETSKEDLYKIISELKAMLAKVTSFLTLREEGYPIKDGDEIRGYIFRSSFVEDIDELRKECIHAMKVDRVGKQFDVEALLKDIRPIDPE